MRATATTDWRALAGDVNDLETTGAELTQLCSGSGSATFEVRPPIGQRHALKVLHDADPGLGRTEEDLRALLDINHPNVATYLSTGTVTWNAGAYRWLTMAFVDGESLAFQRDRTRLLTPPAIAALLQDATAGAAAMWAAGVAHRDLTPDNMIVTSSGRLVVVDVGMSQTADASAAERQAAVELEVATPRWTAPEQSGPDAILGDWRSDQYALGLLGHWLMTGEEPVGVRSGGAMGRSGSTLRATGRLDELMPLAQVVEVMLSSDPDERWPSPEALLDAIDEAARMLTDSDPERHSHA